MGLCIINRAGNSNDSITIDDTLSSVSENPVQNKIINNALSNKVDLQSLSAVATSGSYTDLSDKPTIPHAVAVKGNAETNYRTGNVNLTPANIGAATSNHTHGNIANNGTLSANVAIQNGDRLVIRDVSDSNKITSSNTTFGTSTATYLRNDGTFATPPGIYKGVNTASIQTNQRLIAASGGVDKSYTVTQDCYVELSEGSIDTYSTGRIYIDNVEVASVSSAGNPTPNLGSPRYFPLKAGAVIKVTNTCDVSGRNFTVRVKAFNLK